MVIQIGCLRDRFRERRAEEVADCAGETDSDNEKDGKQSQVAMLFDYLDLAVLDLDQVGHIVRVQYARFSPIACLEQGRVLLGFLSFLPLLYHLEVFFFYGEHAVEDLHEVGTSTWWH